MAGTGSEHRFNIHIAGKADGSLNAAVNAARKALSGLGSAIGNIAKISAAAVGAATTAAVAFAKKSVDVGMQFDSSMSQVAATMGKSMEELKNEIGTVQIGNETFTGDLREFAQYMGKTTAFSASQAADALNYMALANYGVQDSMTMLPSVLDLAASGGIELAAASDMVTDAQSALGLSMDETSMLVDKMAQAASKSNTSVAQMGEAILTVGGTAKMLSGSTTELSTAIGILADNGVKGAEGGTALRNIILSLSAPTDKAAKTMSSLGVNAFDSSGKMRPLNETFGDLNAALSDLTDKEKTQALNSIFNKVDLKSVEAMLSNCGARYDELSGYINDAAGAAKKMADTQLDNLAGDITYFKSALEGAQIVLSDQLSPSLRQFVQFGTKAIGRLTDAFKEGGLAGAMTEMGTVLSDGISMITGMLPDMIDAGMGLAGALGQGLIDNLPQITGAAADILTSFAKGIISAIPKLVPAIGGIIKSLASGIKENLPVLLRSAKEAVRELGTAVREGLPEIMTILSESVTDIAMTLTDPGLLSDILKTGTDIITALADGLAEAVPRLADAVPQIITNLVSGISNAVPKMLVSGISLITSLTNGIMKAMPKIIDGIRAIIEGLVNFLTKNLPVIIEMGVQLVMSLVQGIGQNLPALIQSAADLVTALLKGLMAMMPVIARQGVVLVRSLLQGIISALPSVLEGAIAAVISFIQGVLSMLPDIFNSAIDLVMTLVQGITSMLPSIVQQGISIVLSLVNGIIAALPSILEGALAAAVSFIQGIVKMLPDIIKAGIDLIMKLLTGIAKALPSLLKAATKIPSCIINAIFEVNWLEVGWDIIKGIASSVWEGAKSLFKGVGNFIAGLFGFGGDDEEEAAPVPEQTSGAKKYAPVTDTNFDMSFSGFDSAQYFSGMSDEFISNSSIMSSAVSNVNFSPETTKMLSTLNGNDEIGQILKDSGAAIETGYKQAGNKAVNSIADIQARIRDGRMKADLFPDGLRYAQSMAAGIESGKMLPVNSAADIQANIRKNLMSGDLYPTGLDTASRYAAGFSSGTQPVINSASDVAHYVNDRLSSVKDSYSSLAASTKPAINSAADVAYYFKDRFQNVSNDAAKMSGDTQKSMSDMASAMQTEANKAKTSVVNTFSSMKSEIGNISLYDTGVNLMKGLYDGIVSMQQGLINKAGEIADNISRKINQTLQIHSPSRVTMKTGEFVDMGLIEGMKSKADEISAMSSGLAGKIKSALENELSAKLPAIETAVNVGISEMPDMPAIAPPEIQQVQMPYQAAETIQAAQMPTPEIQEILIISIPGLLELSDAKNPDFDWIGSTLDTLDTGNEYTETNYSNSQPIQITYSPKYNFDGNAPARSDIVEAEKMSQKEFRRMMAEWLKENKRTVFR